MSEVKVSIVASANRVKWWERFCNSLKDNTISFEVIFVGDTRPMHNLPGWFRFIHATVKPAQCYEIGFRAAKGELIHWTADDADYVCRHPETGNIHTKNIDRAYEAWVDLEKRTGNKKLSVIAMRPIENGGDVWKFHHFFGGWDNTPTMAPFGFVSRDKFHELGGYDSRFVSGQSENDVVMRFIEKGGAVEVVKDSLVYVHHQQVHPRDAIGKEDNKFRAWYNTDRMVLENCWIPAGYGNYEKQNKNVTISPTRLSPVQRFSDENITTVTQGEYKGMWK